MLRHRVIPLILLDGYSVVKTIKFDVRRNLGNPIVVSRIYNSRNVDELFLLDIDASKEHRGIDLQTVNSVASQCFMPVTVGGGLHSCEDISKVLQAGADRVSINTALWRNPSFLEKAVSVFGSQCIVASLDVKMDNTGKYILHSHANLQIGLSLESCISLLTRIQVGEILINNVDLDGTMCGFDLDLIKYISSLTSVHIVAAGGASSPTDCGKVIQAGASAVSAASIFHFTSITPQTCKEGMSKMGIPMRL
jgi:imidazole glycerol-phosphate synthase subunit HisF